MTPLGHAGAALLTGLAASKIFPGFERETVIASVTLGGIFPDWDVIYHNLKTKTKFLDKNIGDHRFQITHTPLFMLIIGFILTPMTNYAWFFIFGTFVHLLLDTLFFPEGIIFFYPFSKKNYNFFEIHFPSFWSNKPITRVEGWYKNYLVSPLFWIFEVAPTIIAVMFYFLT